MGKFLVTIFTIAFLLSGCSGSTKTDEQNLVKEPVLNFKAEVAERDFIYRLVSEKSIYPNGEKVELYAELEYVGDQSEIQIAHASSPFYFPMKERTRGYEIEYSMTEPRVVTTLKKGVPLREQYNGGGGYGSQDPKEYVDFIKETMAASKTGTLPWGNYLVSGLASFEPIFGSEESQDNKYLRLEAEIEFVVEKPKIKDSVSLVQYEETVGELAYEVQLNKNIFGMNDEIEMNVKVTNLGDEILSYVKGSSSCPIHVDVNIVNEESGKHLILKPVERNCTADLSKAQLETNQSVEQKFTFVAKHYSKSELVPAKPGTYEVQVSLPPEDIEVTEDYQPKPINVRPSAKTTIILR